MSIDIFRELERSIEKLEETSKEMSVRCGELNVKLEEIKDAIKVLEETKGWELILQEVFQRCEAKIHYGKFCDKPIEKRTSLIEEIFQGKVINFKEFEEHLGIFPEYTKYIESMLTEFVKSPYDIPVYSLTDKERDTLIGELKRVGDESKLFECPEMLRGATLKQFFRMVKEDLIFRDEDSPRERAEKKKKIEESI